MEFCVTLNTDRQCMIDIYRPMQILQIQIFVKEVNRISNDDCTSVSALTVLWHDSFDSPVSFETVQL